MATIASALDTEFTPAAGDFIVQCTNGTASLMRKNSSGAAFASIGSVSEAVNVDNPVAGAVYKFRRETGSPAVQADQ
jgi:hypothetical protein